jgi:hypothetical protein
LFAGDAANDKVIASGTTGDCSWTLTANGAMTISGNGVMEDYEYNKGAFIGCRGLTSIINFNDRPRPQRIYTPVKRSSKIVSDTSEFFARSLKLLRLMDDESEKEEKNAVDVKETASNLDEEKKIGVIDKRKF